MSETCNQIAADIIRDCLNPPVRGQKNRVIVIPRRIIESITYNSSNHLIIENIALATSTRGFEYVGDASMLNTNISKTADEFGTGYMHMLPFKIYGNTPAIKKELEALSEETDGVMVIIEQNYKGTVAVPNAKWVVLGKDAGLRPTVLEDTEGRNIYSITLGSADGYPEPHLPANVYITSETVTDALVESLLVAQST